MKKLNEIKYNILIVDDEKDICNLLKRYLSLKLHDDSEMHTASSYERGLEKLNDNTYDLCIYDYNLGDGNGLDLLKKTREMNPTSSTMIMSADVSDKQIKDFYTNGAYTFIKKPLKLKQIDDIIASIADLTNNAYEKPSENSSNR